MFFTLSKQHDPRFFHHKKINDLILSHDDGWIPTPTGWFKGYQIPNQLHGSWTHVTFDGEQVLIDHDSYRSYPLWYNEQTHTVTNLLGQGSRIWADRKISLNRQEIKFNFFDPIGSISIDPLTQDQWLIEMCDNLKHKLQGLYSAYPDAIKRLFVSGGVDTLLLYSLLKSEHANFELMRYEHVEYNRFMDINFSNIKQQHWGYSQIHHWNHFNMLISGSWGDECLMRGPTTLALWAAWHNIDLVPLLKKSKGYHSEYFCLPKNLKIISETWSQRNEIKDQYSDYTALVQQILNINVNDHQHWHLGNTITWTPLKDLELTKLLLRTSPDDILKHITDATLQKKLIEHLYPPAVNLISAIKNHNSKENLYQLD
jgi:hypothetical protein